MDYNETDGLNITTKYTYDLSGQVIEEKDPNGNIRKYEYSSLDQLVRAIESSPLEYVANYSYDKNGNLSKSAAHLGFETPRQYVAKSVLRTAPCLLGLFSIICLIFAEHIRRHRIRIRSTRWYVKTEPTFSDAIATVRRLFWKETIFEKASHHKGFKKLPPKLRNMLLDYLSQAA